MRPLIVFLFLLGLALSSSQSTGESPSQFDGARRPEPVEGACPQGSENRNCQDTSAKDRTSACNPSCPQLAALNSKLETLNSQLALWGDRGRVDLVEALIYYENASLPFQARRDMAKAFVKAADNLQIPLLAGVAIADVESNFSNHVTGRHGEASLMQILPLPGRPAAAQLRSDPQLAIFWALENCFSPSYHQALAEGKSPEEALKIGLKKYNSRDSYVEKVYRRYLWMKDFEAKGLYGWE